MRFLLLTVLSVAIAAAAFADDTNATMAGVSTGAVSVPVFTASTPNAVILPEKAMREAERLSRNRTRDSYPGAAHEVSVVVEASRHEPRGEESRTGAAPTNKAVAVSGAMTVRDGAGPVTAPMTPAQREAQRATQARKDSPVKAER